MNGRLRVGSGPPCQSRPMVEHPPKPTRNAMRRTLPMIALATGGPGPDGQDGRARADKVKGELSPHLDEDLRIVGALAELFATAAAERLVNAGLSLGSGTADDGRASTEGRRKSMRSTLPMIALATGTALCTAALAQARPRLRSRRRRRGDEAQALVADAIAAHSSTEGGSSCADSSGSD